MPEQPLTLVTLSYDGGTTNHVEVVLPELDRRGLKATFFLDPFEAVQNVVRWREAAQSGHELGNGALLTAAQPNGHLSGWTTEMIYSEVDEADHFLSSELGAATPASFAYPFGEPVCADGLYVVNRPRIRSPKDGPNFLPLTKAPVRAIHTEGWTLADFVHVLTKPDWIGHWLVFAINGVGESPGIDRRDHAELLTILSDPARFEVLPFADGCAKLGPV